MQIFIASSNPHKVKEIKAILDTSLRNLHIELQSIQSMNIPEPDEPYKTFMENARHKAKYYAQFTHEPTLSEDAGLCIQALDNFPGVYTKDFVLESGSLTSAFKSLEKMLFNKKDLSAYFVCACAVYFPQENRFITYEGKDAGKFLSRLVAINVLVLIRFCP